MNEADVNAVSDVVITDDDAFIMVSTPLETIIDADVTITGTCSVKVTEDIT